MDVPYAEEIAGLQRTALAELTSPHRLSAIRSAELKYGEKNILTLPELMSSLTESVWTEAWNAPGRNAGPLRRELQRAWVDRLVELLLAPPEGTLGDARALARRELDRIDERLGKRLTPPHAFDPYTEAHLRDVQERIGKALAAAYAVPPKS